MPNVTIFQPSDRVDHVTPDGMELTQRPYPIVVTYDGAVVSIHGGKLLGFADDLAVQQVDLRWAEVCDEPQKAVGKYPVILDAKGVISTHLNAIMEVTQRTV